MAKQRSDYSYYPKLWQKAFLLEVLRKDTGVLLQSFAFSLPPESVKIEVPQRVNTTKTFGGIYVDDYGIDVAQIRINGSTGNSQLKEVFHNGSVRYIDGKNEAYFILEEIMQYKQGYADYDKLELRLYDLSTTVDLLSYSSVSVPMEVSGWIVVLKDADFSRNKDRPLFYSYSLDFIGIEPLGKKHYKFDAAFRRPAIESIFEAIDKIKAGADRMKKLLSSYKAIIDQVKLVEEALDRIESNVRQYYKATQGFITTTIDGVNSVFDSIAFPFDLTEDLLAAGRDLRDGVEEAFATIEAGWNDLTERPANIAAMFNDLMGIEDGIAEIRTEAKATGSLPEVQIVPNNAPGSSRAVNETDPNAEAPVSFLLTYGYYEITATSETRLDVLSTQVYGTPDYADTLASYNGITGDSEIVPGLKLQVPFLSYTPALRDNEVYDETQNAYGTDILLGPDGDLVLAEFGDFATISGLDNIGQAIILRTTELSGARVRLENYGIKNAGGGYDALSLAVLISSIKDTLVQDPRIRTVRDFSFSTTGDALAISYYAELETGGTARFSMNL